MGRDDGTDNGVRLLAARLILSIHLVLTVRREESSRRGAGWRENERFLLQKIILNVLRAYNNNYNEMIDYYFKN